MTGPIASVDELLDLEPLEADLAALRARYRSADPFPHIVLDDVVRPEPLAAAYAEFAAVSDNTWRKYLHVNERKYANTDLTTWGPVLRSLAEAFASDRFVRFLSELSGHDDLIADLSLDGGGLHRSPSGGYLNVHADFTAHHTHQDWRRRVNLLLYLNPTWEPSWGGELELWSTDMERCVERVEPVGNRMLLFTTDADAYHGHPEPLACPPDVARQSLALYYFSEEPDPLVRSTDYRARPGDGAKRAAIFLDKQVLHLYDVTKRRLRLSDDTVSTWLGRLDDLRPGRRRRRGDDTSESS